MIDVQSTKVEDYNKKIHKVGIRGVPVLVKYKDMETYAKTSCYVSLKHNKGIHMSRLVQSLNRGIWDINDTITLKTLLNDLQLNNKDYSEDYYIEFNFDYVQEHEAPVTKIKGYVRYPMKISASRDNKGKDTIKVDIKIPYISLCPCSKEISKNNAHNQRSEAWITIILLNKQYFDCNISDIIDKLIAVVRDTASSNIYSVLKREDEKFVTEEMYERPRFVEDMIRLIDVKMQKLLDKYFVDYNIVVEHFESIHQHSALAITNAGRGLK